MRTRFDVALSAILREGAVLALNVGRILAGDEQAGSFTISPEERSAILAEMSSPEGAGRLLAALILSDLPEGDRER